MGMKPRPTEGATQVATLEDYVSTFSAPWADVVGAIAELVYDEAPDAEVHIEASQPVFCCHGPFMALKAARRAVHLGFLRGGELPDPEGLLATSRGTTRQLAIATLADIPEDALRALIREAVDLNASTSA